MTKTTIRYIGSRFAGQESGSIKDLLKLIHIEPLMESFAPYCSINSDGTINIGGNFERISHGFSFDTNDFKLIREFGAAFEVNDLINKDELYKTPVSKETLVIMGLIKKEVA